MPHIQGRSIANQTNVYLYRSLLNTSEVFKSSARIADDTRTFEDRSDNGCRSRFNFNWVRSLRPRKLFGRMLERDRRGTAGQPLSADYWQLACLLSLKLKHQFSFRSPGKGTATTPPRCRRLFRVSTKRVQFRRALLKDKVSSSVTTLKTIGLLSTAASSRCPRINRSCR